MLVSSEPVFASLSNTTAGQMGGARRNGHRRRRRSIDNSSRALIASAELQRYWKPDHRDDASEDR